MARRKCIENKRFYYPFHVTNIVITKLSNVNHTFNISKEVLKDLKKVLNYSMIQYYSYDMAMTPSQKLRNKTKQTDNK